MSRERNVEAFNEDVESNQGYLYSTTDRLSCRLANQRMSRAIAELARPEGRRVLDVGCGDGTYSLELLDRGAREVLGVDAAANAVEVARSKAQGRDGIRFEVVDIYELDSPGWDVAVVRGILHHLYVPERAIARLATVAREVVVVEPNGYNPVLKILEKVSPYHRDHEEKSYAPRWLDRAFERVGGRIDQATYIGLVPMFSPDWLARLCKVTEPLVERIPFLRAIGCAQYVQRVVFD